MTGVKSPETPKPPSPLATPIVGRETDAAKKKVRGRKKGRAATILAGRMMTERDTGLKNILG